MRDARALFRLPFFFNGKLILFLLDSKTWCNIIFGAYWSIWIVLALKTYNFTMFNFYLAPFINLRFIKNSFDTKNSLQSMIYPNLLLSTYLHLSTLVISKISIFFKTFFAALLGNPLKVTILMCSTAFFLNGTNLKTRISLFLV